MKIQENFTIYIPKNFNKIQHSKIPELQKLSIKKIPFLIFIRKTYFSVGSSFFSKKCDFEILKDSGIPREEIFVNSKIYNTCYNPNLVLLQLEKSLEGNFALTFPIIRIA